MTRFTQWVLYSHDKEVGEWSEGQQEVGVQTPTESNIFTLTFRSLPETFIRRRAFSSGSCRDEGSYTMSHMYDRFLATSHLHLGKNRKKN